MTKHLRFLFVALLMAVYAVGGYAQDVVYSTGFESTEGYTTSTTYNSTTTVGPKGKQWYINYGCISTSSKISGSSSLQMRYYKSKNVTPYAQMNFSIDGITDVHFTAKSAAAGTLKVEYSVDNGSTWNGSKDYTLTANKSTEISYSIAPTALNNVRVKITSLVTEDKKAVCIDDFQLLATSSGSSKQTPTISFSNATETPTYNFVNGEYSEGIFSMPTISSDPEGAYSQSDIVYKSQNEGIVKVNEDNTLSFTGTYGTAPISVQLGAHDDYNASNTIYFNVKNSGIATEIDFEESGVNGNAYTVTEGTTFKGHKATVYDDSYKGEMKYSTTNASVADVDENTGDVTIGTSGTAVISAQFIGTDGYESSNIVSYTINVKGDYAFYESFNNYAGLGGNDDKGFGGNLTTDALKTDLADNKGWEFTSGYPASACVRFGQNSTKGVAKTPEITMTGNGTLTFKAAAWNNKDDATNLIVSTTSGTLSWNGNTGSEIKIDINKNEWTNISVKIIGASNPRITFTGGGDNKSKSRFFLDEVKVKADESASYTYSETDETNNVKACSNATVTIERTLVKDAWNTICLPFTLDADQITEKFGEGTKVAELNYENTTGATVAFSAATTMDAGMPYLIMPTEDAAKLTFENVEIAKITPDYTLGDNTIAFKGTYSKTDINADTDIKDNGFAAFLGSDNTLHKAKEGSKLRGFRAYFVVPAALAGTPMNVAIDGVVTSLKNIDAAGQDADAPVYNLQGQRVDGKTLTRGIYVKAGKKFVVK